MSASSRPAPPTPAAPSPASGPLTASGPSSASGPPSTSGPPSASGIADLPFERALEELEGIVQRLEQGNVPLDESMAIYERGEALKRHCEGLLQRAEARVQRITLGGDGRPTGTTPLDPQGPASIESPGPTRA